MGLRFEIGADDVGRITFDEPDRAHNVLTEEVLRAFGEIVSQAVAANGEGRLGALLIRSAKPASFLAGADVRAISSIVESRDRRRAAEAVRAGQTLFARIAALPVPTAAAIRGICLGGGTELALACDHRVCDDDHRTRIGLPEVRLGILPAWGGTTRLPRLVGVRAALDLMLTGRPVPGPKAKRIGLVDHVFPRRRFEELSLDFARTLAAGNLPKRPAGRRRAGVAGHILDGTGPGRALVLRAARKRVLARTRGHYPAPLEILEVVRTGLGRPVHANLELEAEAAGRLILSPQCRNLLFLSRLRERARKGPWAAGGEAAPVRRIAVIGAGRMGSGIAQVAADHDIPVRMKDVDDDTVVAGLSRARVIFDGAVRRGTLGRTDATRRMELISGGPGHSGMERADLVVEAVVERMDVKRAVLREVEAVVGPSAVIATNTSSLSVDGMATALSRPGRFAGMHFFGPVHRMPLVEVVRGRRTDADTVETIAALAVRLGKVPVVVRDRPGFLVNRILGSALNEAGHLLDEGCGVRSLDRIWRGFGMPMGPCRLIDEVGIDVARHTGDALAAAFGERMAPAASLVALGGSGRPGRKGGRGFYRYGDGEVKGLDRTVYADMGQPSRRSTPDAARVRDRMVLAMVNEAARTLEDGVVVSAADVDLGLAMGAGFPPFRGGPLRYADDRGLEDVLAVLLRFGDDFGSRLRPAPLLVELAKGGGTFHGAFPAAREDRGRVAP